MAQSITEKKTVAGQEAEESLTAREVDLAVISEIQSFCDHTFNENDADDDDYLYSIKQNLVNEIVQMSTVHAERIADEWEQALGPLIDNGDAEVLRGVFQHFETWMQDRICREDTRVPDLYSTHPGAKSMDPKTASEG